MKKKLYILIGVLAIVLAGGFYLNLKFGKKSPNEITTTPSAVSSPTNPTASPEPTSVSEETKLPNYYLIDNVPFQSQAPFANWDELHDEACEEAAIILTKYYLDGKNLSAKTMDEQILAMVSWEEKNWGGHFDLTAEKTGRLAENFYGLKYHVESNINIEDIKKEVVQDNPVIIPTAGRLLGNPYFRSPGPVYHMLIVIGFEGNKIITQDIGTKRGDHYVYNEKILFNAIHDWAGSPENIESGPKVMLVLEK